MEKIIKVWFDKGRIFIKTDQGNTFSRPLEAFPLLFEATEQQRARYEIGLDGDDLHWDEIDEDTSMVSRNRLRSGQIRFLKQSADWAGKWQQFRITG